MLERPMATHDHWACSRQFGEIINLRFCGTLRAYSVECVDVAECVKVHALGRTPCPIGPESRPYFLITGAARR